MAAALEKDLILKLFKDFTTEYNPSSISKGMGRTRVGTFKALKRLECEGIAGSKRLGNALFYSLNLQDTYVKKVIEVLLMEEARHRPRWLDEFQELAGMTKAVILFGSVIKSEKKANDIDLLIVLDQKHNDAVNRFIREKDQLLTRKIHPIKQTRDDLIRNLKRRDKVVLSALREGIVLHGYEEIVKYVTGVQQSEMVY